MASLFDTVKQNGSLMQVSKQDVGSLAAASGAKQPPTNPLAAATLGATPNAAAAAGTANGVQSAVNAMRLNARGTNSQGQARDLGTAIREQQASGQQTAAQAAATAAAQGISPGSNSLQSNVSKLIEQDYSAAAAAATNPVNLTVNTAKLPATYLGGVTQAQFVTALTTVGGLNPDGTQAKPADQETALGVILNGLGGPNAASALLGGQAADVASVSQYFNDTGTILANTIQGKLPTDVTVGQLQPSSLGVSSFNQLDTLLGVQPGTAAGMTIAQLTSAVQAKQAGSYNTAAQWESILTNPTSSNALRATATQMLQGMGVTGALSAEKSVANLTSQVQAANQVTFQGQTMTTAQALSSTTVTATIATILNGIGPNATPADAATVAGMQADPSMASFVTWVQNNATELATATANIGVDAQADAATTTAYQAQWASLTASNPGISQALQGPNFGAVVSTVIPAPPLVAAMAQGGATFQANVNASFGAIPQDQASQLAGLTQEQFNALVPPGVSGQTNNDAIAALAAAVTPVTSAGQMATSMGTLPPNFAGQVAAAKSVQAAGGQLSAASQSVLNTVVMNPDGTLNAAATLKNYQTNFPTQTIAQLAQNGHVPPSLTQDLSTFGTDVTNAVTTGTTGFETTIATNIMNSPSGQANVPVLLNGIVTSTGAAGNFADFSSLSTFVASPASGLTPSQQKGYQTSITAAQTTLTNNLTDTALESAGASGYNATMAVLPTSTSMTDVQTLITRTQTAIAKVSAQQMDPSIIAKLNEVLVAATQRETALQYQADAAAAAAAAASAVNNPKPTLGSQAKTSAAQGVPITGANPVMDTVAGKLASTLKRAF